MADDPPLVKIAFRASDGEVETLWAFDLGHHRYRLDNTPWYQYGVSWKDTVEAIPEIEGEFPVFKQVLEKSGYRTVRIAPEEPATDEFLAKIKDLGCSFEGANRKYLAVDIPPGVDLARVAEFLTASNTRWEYADPTYSEVTGEIDGV